MPLHVRDVFNSRVISLDRDADFYVASDVKREIVAASALRPFVIVSLETCDYCDAACLGAIFEAKCWLGRRLEIVIPASHLTRRLARVLGWTAALRARETLGEALLSCARG